MAPRARVTCVVLLSLAAAFLLTSMFASWWGFERRSPASGARWEHYAPFSTDAGAREGEFDGVVRWVGTFVAAALAVLVLAVAWAGVVLASPDRGFAGPALVAFAGCLLAGGAAGYSVFGFPAEAESVQEKHELEGFDLGFFPGRDCGKDADGDEVCARTRPEVGWYFGVAACLLSGVGMFVGAASGRPTRLVNPRPAAEAAQAAPTPPPKEAATGGRPGPIAKEVAAGRTVVMKCPQCQSRVSFTRNRDGPTVVACYNCGRVIRL